MSGPNATHHDLTELERFVAECDELRDLEALIGRFNIFDALGVVEAEIRHSNFLAWLLDPAESHGQGPLFLKAVLMDLLRQSPPELRPKGLSPITLDGGELRGIEVRREWRSIDLLITCKEPAFVITIENKIRSGEHGRQLQRYKDVVRREFPESPAQFVFLTREGDEPSDDEWTAYTYADLYRVLKRVQQTSAKAIGDDVAAFLDHYLSLIGSRFMDDPKIDELCQTIYKNHRRAIDLIVERGKPNIRAAIEALAAMLEADDDVRTYTSTSRSAFFVPKNWLAILPPVRGPHVPSEPSQWFCGEFRVYDTTCELWFYACPTTDARIRERIIHRLIDDAEEFGFRHSFKKISPRWATIYKRVIKTDFTESANTDALVTKARIALNDLKDRTSRAIPALRPIIEAWEREKKAG